MKERVEDPAEKTIQLRKPQGHGNLLSWKNLRYPVFEFFGIDIDLFRKVFRQYLFDRRLLQYSGQLSLVNVAEMVGDHIFYRERESFEDIQVLGKGKRPHPQRMV